jgi:WD40 repeat protein
VTDEIPKPMSVSSKSHNDSVTRAPQTSILMRFIMGRGLILIACFGLLIPECLSQIESSSVPDVPLDTAILELTLPEGTSFRINDQQYRASMAGEIRILPFRPLPPNQSFTYQLEVQFSDGSVTHRTLALRGGERVRLPILSPHVQRPEFALQTGFPGSVMNGVFSADGNTVLLGSCELIYALYDVSSGRQLRRFTPKPQPKCVPTVPLAISPDRRHLVTGSWDEGTLLWDIESGEQVRHFPAAAGPMAFSPDGKWLAFSPVPDDSQNTQPERSINLWSVHDGVKRLSMQGHSSYITAITFSRDGKFLLTGSEDKTAIVWDLEAGVQRVVLKGHDEPVTAVDFRSDGQQIITGARDDTVILWDAMTGQNLRTLAGENAEKSSGGGIQRGILCIAFLAGGQRIITGGINQPTIVRDLNTGEIMSSLNVNRLVAISPDAKRILARAENSSYPTWDMSVWDLETDTELQSFRLQTDLLSPISLRPDGRRLFSSAMFGDAIIWNMETGAPQSTIPGIGLHISQDGMRALTHDETKDQMNPQLDTPATVFDVETGKSLAVLSEITNHNGVMHSDGSVTSGLGSNGRFVSADGSRVMFKGAAGYGIWDVNSGQKRIVQGYQPVFSPDGHVVLVRKSNTIASLRSWDEWDTSLGKELSISDWTDNSIFVFSPNGKHLAARNASQDVVIWDTRTGQVLRSLMQSKTAYAWKFSPNGQFIVAREKSRGFVVWDTSSGQMLRTLSDSRGPRYGTFSPDGQRFVAKTETQVYLWDFNTGALLKTWMGSSPNFSADGQRILTYTLGKVKCEIRDLRSGLKLRTTSSFEDISFTPNSRQFVIRSEEWTIQFWDIATGDKLCELVSINLGNDWLVFTPEGLFDGSEGGRQKVAFRIGGGLNVVPVDQFFNDFYTPGLLAKIANGERPMPSVELGKELPPKVRIVSPQFGGTIEEPTVTVVIEATDQGGGVRVPWIRHNGARLLAEGITEQTGPTIRLTQELQLVEGENRIEVQSATNNEFATIDSPPAILVLRYEKPLHKPHLHLLAIGTNYAEPSLQLRFARNDAEAIAKLFESRGQSLYEKVHVHLLLDEQVTKSAIKTLLTDKDSGSDTIANIARPEDSLLVLFGGHGTIVGQRYFFIPHAFKRQAQDLETDIRNQGLAADELGDWLASVPCLKRMLIFDTCASGAAVDLVRTSRNPFALRGVIERLNRTQGVFTIAASAATEEAKEVSELGHGVLTYTLLAGLGAVNHGPLDSRRIETSGSQRVVSVMDWFGYADGHVPELMKMYFGKTQDIQFSGQGTSFPVLTLEDTTAESQESR